MHDFLSAVFLTITALLQHPEPPEAVLPLQAAAAAIWRDCQAKSNAEKRSKPPLRRFRGKRPWLSKVANPPGLSALAS